MKTLNEINEILSNVLQELSNAKKYNDKTVELWKSYMPIENSYIENEELIGTSIKHSLHIQKQNSEMLKYISVVCDNLKY